MNCYVFKNESHKDIYRWYIELTSSIVSTFCFEVLFASKECITNEKLVLTGYLAYLSLNDDCKVSTLYTNLHIKNCFKCEFESRFLISLKCPHTINSGSSSSGARNHSIKNSVEEFKALLEVHNMTLHEGVKSTEKVLYIWTNEKVSYPTMNNLSREVNNFSFPLNYKNICICGNMESFCSLFSHSEKLKQLDLCFKRTQVFFYKIMKTTGRHTFNPFIFSFVPFLYSLHDYISEIVFDINSDQRFTIRLSKQRSDCDILLEILQKFDERQHGYTKRRMRL